LLDPPLLPEEGSPPSMDPEPHAKTANATAKQSDRI
jgi:hypothetical protein